MRYSKLHATRPVGSTKDKLLNLVETNDNDREYCWKVQYFLCDKISLQFMLTYFSFLSNVSVKMKMN